MNPILITGGTGTLGSAVTRLLHTGGHEPRVLSRRSRPESTPYSWATGDLHTGDGIDAALAGVDTIIHCATSPVGRGDVESARNLIAAAERVGVGHLVYISIVGIDRVPLPYYRTKLAVEQLIESSALPWTILRTTQFHDLIVRIFSIQRRLPVMLVPAGISDQPIDVNEVAARMIELALAAPAGRVADMGGPQIRRLTEWARTYLQVAGTRRPVVPVPVPGRIGRALRNGGHLARDHAVGQVTFADFLADRVR